MITCKLTGTKGKGVKAHIIPESFYEIPPQTEGVLKLLTNKPETHPKKSPIGTYDKGIVTREGEEYFGPWDNYASEVLLQRVDEFVPITRNNHLAGWSLGRADYSPLKLFALSMLWRAHSSTQEVFRRVDLGAHEPVIRKIILDGNPGDEEHYSVCIVRWIDDELGPVYMDPFLERYEGVNYYRFYCGRYVFYIKVDKRKTGPTFTNVQLAAGRDLVLIARNLRNSKELPLMVQIVHENSR